jgi:hypothetical protein
VDIIGVLRAIGERKLQESQKHIKAYLLQPELAQVTT